MRGISHDVPFCDSLSSIGCIPLFFLLIAELRAKIPLAVWEHRRVSQQLFGLTALLSRPAD